MPLHQTKFLINKLCILNFTLRPMHFQRRNSNCKKEKGASFCKQDSSRSWVGLGEKSKVKTDSFFWQEKLRPRTWRAGFSPPHSKCLEDWECGPDRAHSTGWRAGVGPAAVKHHFCILQQERMSGSSSMCLVLRTDSSSGYFSSL